MIEAVEEARKEGGVQVMLGGGDSSANTFDKYFPSGNNPNFDNLQIAFNAVSEDEKPWYPFPPGTFRGYTGYV